MRKLLVLGAPLHQEEFVVAYLAERMDLYHFAVAVTDPDRMRIGSDDIGQIPAFDLNEKDPEPRKDDNKIGMPVVDIRFVINNGIVG